MSKIKHSLIISTFMMILMLFFAGFTAGCKDKKELTISQKDKIYEVAPGSQTQLEIDYKNIKLEEIEFVILAGEATITDSGLLTIDEDAEVSSTIKVVAKTEEITSNELTFVVVDLAPSAIELTADSTTIYKGQTVNLNIGFDPEYSTLLGYNLEVITGSQYVELNDNELTLKSNYDYSLLSETNKIIEIKATSTADTSVQDIIQIEIVHLKPEEINLTVNGQPTSSQLIEKGEIVTLGASFDPSNATDTSYTIEIVEGEEYVDYDADEQTLKLKDDFDTTLIDRPEGVVVTVKVASDAYTDGSVYSQVDFRVVHTKPESINISAVGNKTEITLDETINFNVEVAPSNATQKGYELRIGKGGDYAEIISNQLKLKTGFDGSILNDSDEENDYIEIYAVSTAIDTIKSNTVKIKIVHLNPTSLTLNTDYGFISKQQPVTFSVNYTPANTTMKDVTATIIEGTEYAEISGNVVSLKSSFDNSIITGAEKVKVKVVSNADNSVYNVFELIIVDDEDIVSLIANNININTSKDSSKTISVIAVNAFDGLLQVSNSNLTFESSDVNEDVIYIDQNGKIYPKGHGEATVTITAENGVSTICKVFVMVPPKEFSLNNISADILNNEIDFHYSKVDKLVLDFTINPGNFTSCAQELDYQFIQLDENDEPIESGDAVATVSEDGIEFEKVGKIQVIVSTNSSLNGANTSTSEKRIEFFVNVNEGININSVQDLVAFANQDTNAVANINNNILLDENNNFGTNETKTRYNTLLFRGDRIINGNGFRISLENLPLLFTDDDSNEGAPLLKFTFKEKDTPFTVEIFDLEVLGNISVNGTYNGKLSYNESQSKIFNQAGKIIKTYTQGIEIFGGRVNANAEELGTAYVKDLLLNNIKVSGFNMGLSIKHAVNGELNNLYIDNCFCNGITSDQNIMTITNLTVGKVGAFAIEQTSDDMRDKKTANPTGTAGVNYDETSKITLAGSIVSNNYTNGADTPYIMGLSQNFGLGSFNELVETIVGGIISQCPADKQLQAMQVAYECLKHNEDDDYKGMLNFYQLIFVDPTTFDKYDDGNTKGDFAKFEYDSKDVKMISLEEVILNICNDPTYDDYKNYDYISLTLETGPQYFGNIGECIFINEAKN